MASNNADWTSEQMIENANNWSLAGDVALLNSLKKFSESLLSETVSINTNVDNLLNNLENVSLKLELTKNEFQSLRNTQFIENRVYEDDETLENNENKKEEKELTEEEKENAVKESISKGLKIMKKYFDKVEVAVSDSEEDENEKSYILQPKDPYADRPLPYLVGSQDWYKKWHVGLLPSESESESEKEEEAYSSSDSEECLPKDRILGSETSSELDFTQRATGPVANSTFNDSHDRRREVFHSSDESSEQSNSLPAKAPISNQNFAEQLAAKLGDVINNTAENLENVNRNPIRKMNHPTKYGNLFSDEPPPLDDLDDTVLPKSAQEGLFSGGRDLFADNNEEDLLWGQQYKTGQNLGEKDFSAGHADDKSKPRSSKSLFDKSDGSSEEDMFAVAEKRKVKISQPYLQPFKATVPFVDDQPPELTPKSEGGPSKKKPVGGVSIFGEKANIFGENSRRPGVESTKTIGATQKTQEIESKSAENVKTSLKKTSLFDESSDEDVMPPQDKKTVAKKSNNEQVIKKLSLFDDTDDILPTKNPETLKKPAEKKKLSLFDDIDDDLPPKRKDTVKNSEEKKTVGLFDEDPYQNVDLFKPTSKEISDKTRTLNKPGAETKKPMKKITLFDDDDDFLKEEEDIFAGAPKKRGLFDDFEEIPGKKPSIGLFEDIEGSSDTSSKASKNDETHSNKPSKSLFEDFEASSAFEDLSGASKVEDELEKRRDASKETMGEEKLDKNPTKTLFDDLESSTSSEDLFGSHKNDSIKARSSIAKERLAKQGVAVQEEGHSKRKVTENLFEEIESSSSEEAIFGESKSEVLGVKTLETGKNVLGEHGKTLNQAHSERITKKSIFEDLESSGGKEQLFNIGGSNAESSDKGFVQLGKDIFEDEERDLFKDGKNEDKNSKSGEERPMTAVLDFKAKTIEDSFGFEDLKVEKIENVEGDGATAGNNEEEGVLGLLKGGNIKSGEVVDAEAYLCRDEAKTNIKDDANVTEDIVGRSGVPEQNKNDILGKIKKDVGFLDSVGDTLCKKTQEDEGKSAIDDDSIVSKEKIDVSEKRHGVSDAVVRQQEDLESIAGLSKINTEKSKFNVNITESPPKHETPNPNAHKIYSIPPPLDLFDPTPPPPDLDWDAASDNSGESDTFSLTDGILDRTNFTQSQARSSLFNEAPPSLDVNESSGIGRDLNVTRMETDDSSFYPYATSSRRLSSDIFGEQQSQDSFFVTKDRTDLSAQPGASLGKISENGENLSSKIENLTPSGNIDDFEGSSVFERTGNESKDSKSMSAGSISDMPKPDIKKRDPLFVKSIEDTRDEDISAPKKSSNVKESASSFEAKGDSDRDNRSAKKGKRSDGGKSDSSPIKTSPGKLKHNLNINVGALMPGATRPKIHSSRVPQSTSPDETDKSASSIRPVGGASRGPPLLSPVAGFTSEILDDEVAITLSDDGKFASLSQTEVLHSTTKDRARIPVKRRPSTRRARQEAVRKSVTDFSLYQSEDNASVGEEQSSRDKKISQTPSNDGKNKFLTDLNNKSVMSDGVPKKETSKNGDSVNKNEDVSEVKGISLVFDENNKKKPVRNEEILENPVAKGMNDKSEISKEEEASESVVILKEDDSKSDKKDTTYASSAVNTAVASKSSKILKTKESKSIFEDSFEDNSYIFQSTSKTGDMASGSVNKSLFGAGGSSSDEDLFSGTTKPSSKDVVFSTNERSKTQEVSTKKDAKSNIFSDKSESEGDGDLFVGISKKPAAKTGKQIVGETSKKGNIFDDSGDSSEEDLFGSKTSKTGSGSRDFSTSKGSILGTTRVRSKNVKIASVKRLDNKEVTDFDPLSALK